MPDEVELIARAERAERRLAELQTMLRETDREEVHKRMTAAIERTDRAMRDMAIAHRTYRLWLRRLRTADRLVWMLVGANAFFTIQCLWRAFY